MTPVDAEAVWSEAGPLFASALEGYDDTAEEVLARCLAGSAQLLASPRAFVVIEAVPFAEGFDLLIWAAVSRGAGDCIDAHLQELERLAAKMGARRLAYKTSRRGFERVMPAGWTMMQVLWAKEVGNGGTIQ